MNQEIEKAILNVLRKNPTGLSSVRVVELVNTQISAERITGGEARRTLFELMQQGHVYNDKQNTWYAVKSVVPEVTDEEPVDDFAEMVSSPVLRASEVDLNKILAVAAANGFYLSAQQEFPARQASYNAVPAGLHPTVKRFLQHKYPQGLWSHQSLALDLVISNRNVGLITPTASGKTLVFTAAAAHLIESAKGKVKVLALYPQKALIADQFKKWQEFSDKLKFSIGYVDGNVPVSERERVLKDADVVLMTPDVAHAWLMANLRSKEIQRFLFSLNLLILDEAHVYQGIFGTNMSLFLRRLQCCTNSIRIICSTATVADDESFLRRLLGRSLEIIDSSVDGSPAPGKILALLSENERASFPALLAELGELPDLRLLAFCDSRKGVEQFGHLTTKEQSRRESLRSDSDYCGTESRRILPYRAGYEAIDRSAIQAALTTGELAGVISTSALEVGIDIGDLDLVILYGVPPDSKSFWQRFGRVGRSKPGYCLLVDNRNVIHPSESGLASFVQKPIESNLLYFDNKYIQFAHAVCAEKEFAALCRSKCMQPDKLKRRYELAFGKVANKFVEYMETTTSSSDVDLSALSKRLSRDPHHVLTLRTGIEQNYQVIDQSGRELGDLTYAQLLREAYPGAVYYYMAKPYRVTSVDSKVRKVWTKRETPFSSTKPIEDSFVFPELNKEVYSHHAGTMSTAAELNVTALERVYGFTEGEKQTLYDADCEYAAAPLTRRFKTTGVCLYAGVVTVEEWLVVAGSILTSYCSMFSVHPAELGYGTFKDCTDPIDNVSTISGLCIYDSVMGGLRLTQRLAPRVSEVLALALEKSKQLEANAAEALLLAQTQAILNKLTQCFTNLTSRPLAQQNRANVEKSNDHQGHRERPAHPRNESTAIATQFEPGTEVSLEVIAEGEMARYQLNFKKETVKILSFRLRADGLYYSFYYPNNSVLTWAHSDRISPNSKSTKLQKLELTVKGDRE